MRRVRLRSSLGSCLDVLHLRKFRANGLSLELEAVLPRPEDAVFFRNLGSRSLSSRSLSDLHAKAGKSFFELAKGERIGRAM